MSSRSDTGATVTFPLLGLLGILFVGLKLTGHIDWSWWWVTLPFWGGFALVLGIIVLYLAGMAAGDFLKGLRK